MLNKNTEQTDEWNNNIKHMESPITNLKELIMYIDSKTKNVS